MECAPHGSRSPSFGRSLAFHRLTWSVRIWPKPHALGNARNDGGTHDRRIGECARSPRPASARGCRSPRRRAFRLARLMRATARCHVIFGEGFGAGHARDRDVIEKARCAIQHGAQSLHHPWSAWRGGRSQDRLLPPARAGSHLPPGPRSTMMRPSTPARAHRARSSRRRRHGWDCSSPSARSASCRLLCGSARRVQACLDGHARL